MKKKRNFVEHTLVRMSGFDDDGIGVFFNFQFFSHRQAFPGKNNNRKIFQFRVLFGFFQQIVRFHIRNAHVKNHAVDFLAFEGFNAFGNIAFEFGTDVKGFQIIRQRFGMFGVVLNDEYFLRLVVQYVFDFFKYLLHLFKSDGFVHKINGSFHQAFVFQLVRRHDMDGNRTRGRIGFQGIHHLPATHDGQLNIQQYTQRSVFNGQSQSFISSHGHNALVAFPSGIVKQRFGKVGIIFNDKNHLITCDNTRTVVRDRFRNQCTDVFTPGSCVQRFGWSYCNGFFLRFEVRF